MPSSALTLAMMRALSLLALKLPLPIEEPLDKLSLPRDPFEPDAGGLGIPGSPSGA